MTGGPFIVREASWGPGGGADCWTRATWVPLTIDLWREWRREALEEGGGVILSLQVEMPLPPLTWGLFSYSALSSDADSTGLVMQWADPLLRGSLILMEEDGTFGGGRGTLTDWYIHWEASDLCSVWFSGDIQYSDISDIRWCYLTDLIILPSRWWDHSCSTHSPSFYSGYIYSRPRPSILYSDLIVGAFDTAYMIRGRKYRGSLIDWSLLFCHYTYYDDAFVLIRHHSRLYLHSFQVGPPFHSWYTVDTDSLPFDNLVFHTFCTVPDAWSPLLLRWPHFDYTFTIPPTLFTFLWPCLFCSTFSLFRYREADSLSTIFCFCDTTSTWWAWSFALPAIVRVTRRQDAVALFGKFLPGTFCDILREADGVPVTPL